LRWAGGRYYRLPGLAAELSVVILHEDISTDGLLLMAQSGHSDRRDECPLLGVKQTSKFKGVMSAFEQPAQPVDATLYRRGKR